MKKIISLICFVIALMSISCVTENHEVSLIPQPNNLEFSKGSFKLTRKTIINTENSVVDVKPIVEQLNSFLSNEFGFVLEPGRAEGKQIQFIKSEDLKAEAYDLSISAKSIVIKAFDYNGFYYGFISLKQLIYPAYSGAKEISIPCLTINDAPNFSWRGMHLDVSRHFYSKEQVMKMIDGLAMHKMNVFHWHLTDDQGWRIEIKKYPKLTTEAAWREETIIGHMADYPEKYDGIRYGGFYTQDEIKEVIQFAKERGVTIVPEIEMPGHAVAVLKAYPELSCSGGPIPPFNEWGVTDDVFCAGNDKTFDFLQDVLDEVVDLFPSEFIHIGGDECPKGMWEKCKKCQNRIRKHKLKDEHELQSYFVKRIEKYLDAKGKKLIGWDEILEGGLPERASVMCWRGDNYAVAAANDSHKVVMTPNPITYLDHYQSLYNEPLAIAGLTDLKEIYDWGIMPEGISENSKKYIIGAQVNMWTEYILNDDHLEYMVYPRLVAMAEKLWTSNENQSYDDFIKRLDINYYRLDKKDIAYRIQYPLGYDPENVFLEKNITVSLDNGIPSSEIYYTLDGTKPDKNSPKYEKPFVLDLDREKIVKAITIMPSGRKSKIHTGVFKQVNIIESTSIENLEPGLIVDWVEEKYSSANDVKTMGKNLIIIDSIHFTDVFPNNWFGSIFSGFIKIDSSAMYSFKLISDDGAILNISGTEVINNDGYHYGQTRFGKIALEKGYHPIELKYFQGKYGKELSLEMYLENSEKQLLNKYTVFHK